MSKKPYAGENGLRKSKRIDKIGPMEKIKPKK
jgi:hypothetical protein